MKKKVVVRRKRIGWGLRIEMVVLDLVEIA
jgi:hypothetical protein